MRNLGAITPNVLESEIVEYWDFLKIELPLPFGTIRLTSRPYGFSGDIDGSVQQWIEADFKYGPIKQSRTDIMVVNWVSIATLDYDWINYAFNPGIKNVPVSLYQGWWGDNGVFLDKYIMFEGRLDDGEFTDRARMTMKPHLTPWDQPVPASKIGGKCINDYRNPLDCNYQGAEPDGQQTCGKIRADCRLRNWEHRINIFENTPEPGFEIVWGGDRHGLPPNPIKRRA